MKGQAIPLIGAGPKEGSVDLKAKECDKDNLKKISELNIKNDGNEKQMKTVKDPKERKRLEFERNCNLSLIDLLKKELDAIKVGDKEKADKIKRDREALEKGREFGSIYDTESLKHFMYSHGYKTEFDSITNETSKIMQDIMRDVALNIVQDIMQQLRQITQSDKESFEKVAGEKGAKEIEQTIEENMNKIKEVKEGEGDEKDKNEKIKKIIEDANETERVLVSVV